MTISYDTCIMTNFAPMCLVKMLNFYQ